MQEGNAVLLQKSERFLLTDDRHPSSFSSKLHLMQLKIKPFLYHQLFMRAHFPDFALVQHQDLAGFADGGQSMGDHDGRAARNELADGFLEVHQASLSCEIK